MIIIKLNFPTKPINYNKWLEESIKEDEETKIIYDVEKVNKDVVFEYPIPKVDDQETLLVEKEIDDNDFVIGIRPEFIEINEK
ncbi:MAG TPA: ABC transporter ATP-binding protein, partial [Acholeplasmataceae bacterium]|nr:ABC transporter ATP-binding protein [Acholeplasmataceae bacterium]